MSNKTEMTLDKDFLMFLTAARTLHSQIINESESDLCHKWLKKLCGEKWHGVPQKRQRNIYLSQLLTQMQEGRLCGVFARPPGNKLLPAKKVFSQNDRDSESEGGEFSIIMNR